MKATCKRPFCKNNYIFLQTVVILENEAKKKNTQLHLLKTLIFKHEKEYSKGQWILKKHYKQR